jgi:3-hydroxymyristoyl/3-hydroxydecanoyl-(acyl carrier protein) dehydratase
VLEVEAMAQAAGIMTLYGSQVDNNKTMLFMGVDKCRFRGIVRPGDKLRMEVEMLQSRRGIIRFAGKCFVGPTITCEAEMMAMIVDKQEQV